VGETFVDTTSSTNEHQVLPTAGLNSFENKTKVVYLIGCSSQSLTAMEPLTVFYIRLARNMTQWFYLYLYILGFIFWVFIPRMVLDSTVSSIRCNYDSLYNRLYVPIRVKSVEIWLKKLLAMSSLGSP
jgi:hypothetical protein